MGAAHRETTALVCPLNVACETIAASARGSCRVMCLAEDPAARSDKDGSAVRESIGWGVVRLETRLDVVRS